MLDRRQHPRSALAEALAATLRLVEDVVLESFGSSEMTIVSSVPARPDQNLAIAPFGGAPISPLDVLVTESRPAIVDGVLKHRVRLRVVNHDRVERPRLFGALIRQLPVRVLDMSAGGCLLESNVPVGHGTGGEVQLDVGGEVKSDVLRVCRCQLVPGAGSMFRLGAQFSHARDRQSLRELVERPVDQEVVG
jgi:hypothetical protein